MSFTHARSKLAPLAALTVSVAAGCAVTPADDAGVVESRASSTTTTFRPGEGGVTTIPICFKEKDRYPVAEQELRRALEDTWQRVANIVFTGWTACEHRFLDDVSPDNGVMIIYTDADPRVHNWGQGDTKVVLNYAFKDPHLYSCPTGMDCFRRDAILMFGDLLKVPVQHLDGNLTPDDRARAAERFGAKQPGTLMTQPGLCVATVGGPYGAWFYGAELGQFACRDVDPHDRYLGHARFDFDPMTGTLKKLALDGPQAETCVSSAAIDTSACDPIQEAIDALLDEKRGEQDKYNHVTPADKGNITREVERLDGEIARTRGKLGACLAQVAASSPNAVPQSGTATAPCSPDLKEIVWTAADTQIRFADRCLTREAADRPNAERLVLRSCNDVQTNQFFRFAGRDHTGTICDPGNVECLGTRLSDPAELYSPAGATAAAEQTWTLRDGTIGSGGQCLTLPDPEYGTAAVLAPCDGSPAQRFVLDTRFVARDGSCLGVTPQNRVTTQACIPGTGAATHPQRFQFRQ